MSAISAFATALSAIMAVGMLYLAQKQLKITADSIEDENKRKKLQATINAVQAADLRFQKTNWELEKDKIFENEKKFDLLKLDEETKQKMEGALTPLEYLAAGKNMGIYDVAVGRSLFQTHLQTSATLYKSIKGSQKCGKKAHDSRYRELEQLCEELKKCGDVTNRAEACQTVKKTETNSA